MEGAARSASRWMWASASLDCIPILGMALAVVAARDQEFEPGAYPLILLGVVIVSGLVGTTAWWKTRAGRLLRRKERSCRTLRGKRVGSAGARGTGSRLTSTRSRPSRTRDVFWPESALSLVSPQLTLELLDRCACLRLGRGGHPTLGCR